MTAAGVLLPAQAFPATLRKGKETKILEGKKEEEEKAVSTSIKTSLLLFVSHFIFQGEEKGSRVGVPAHGRGFRT